jgi:hypothetical protein
MSADSIMANLSLTRVNQKLGQARALLQQSDEARLTEVHRQSLLEGACFHLVCAYQHYLRELGENYGLKNSSAITTEEELAKALAMAGKHPAEAEELRQLRQVDSWLASLHVFYQSLWQTPKPVAQSDEGLINLIDLDQAPPSVSLEMLRQWHSEFAALVRRQRETSAEF